MPTNNEATIREALINADERLKFYEGYYADLCDYHSQEYKEAIAALSRLVAQMEEMRNLFIVGRSEQEIFDYLPKNLGTAARWSIVHALARADKEAK